MVGLDVRQGERIGVRVAAVERPGFVAVGQEGGGAGAVADFGAAVVEEVGVEARVGVAEDGDGEGEVGRRSGGGGEG